MAGQVSHARRALRVIQSFELAKDERLSLAAARASGSEPSNELEQDSAAFAGVSPVLEQVAVGDYPHSQSEADGKQTGFATTDNNINATIRPTVIGGGCCWSCLHHLAMSALMLEESCCIS